jgi:hypothetical protein
MGVNIDRFSESRSTITTGLIEEWKNELCTQACWFSKLKWIRRS